MATSRRVTADSTAGCELPRVRSLLEAREEPFWLGGGDPVVEGCVGFLPDDIQGDLGA